LPDCDDALKVWRHEPDFFVVAVSRNGVIGRTADCVAHFQRTPRFKAITMGKPLIMGRKTWESLPKKPLPGGPTS
jgi:dihydrofolate reductase